MDEFLQLKDTDLMNGLKKKMTQQYTAHNKLILLAKTQNERLEKYLLK